MQVAETKKVTVKAIQFNLGVVEKCIDFILKREGEGRKKIRAIEYNNEAGSLEVRFGDYSKLFVFPWDWIVCSPHGSIMCIQDEEFSSTYEILLPL